LFRVVFGAARQLIGGRVRLIMSGGAPLSPDTHELIKTCLCVTVIQGYGLTETTSLATVMDSKFPFLYCLFVSSLVYLPWHVVLIYILYYSE
jgi:long-subunit acyl-CoA synthetase (AMP-forming)